MSDSGWRGFVFTVALSAAVAAAAIWSHEPRAPRNDPAPGAFSAIRAREMLQRLVGDGVAHPVGSAGNAAVRQRVIDELTRLGYAPTTQEAFVCGDSGVCATVTNVLARLPGNSGARAVMLAAHYDSVPAGPGASDDGMGVAVMLEAARILRQEGPRRNPVLFLIDDAEEAGLLGARAFVRDHPWARDVGAVVNLDSRGTTGSSLLFETSDDNRWLIDLAAASLPRPDTSSLFDTIYKWLPNDTDLTVFRRAGLAGVNFAHIGDVERYHTPLDNFANASAATLGEHGAHVLAMARALAQADLEAPHRGNAVFFDVFGLGIVRWRDEATPFLAAAAALLVAAAIGSALARGTLRLAELLWGIPAVLLALAVSAAAGAGAAALIRAAGHLSTSWIAHPEPTLIAVWTFSCAGAWLAAHFFARRSGWRGLWAATWASSAALSLVLAWAEPALAFLTLVPCALAGAAGLLALRSLRPAAAAFAAALPAAAAAFFWLPMAWLLYGALGARSPAIGAAVGMWAGAAAPAFLFLSATQRRRLLLAIGASGLLAIVAGFFVSPHDAAVPERMQIVREQEPGAGTAQWMIFPESDRLPSRFAEAGFRAARERRAVGRRPPWLRRAGAAPGPPFAAAGRPGDDAHGLGPPGAGHARLRPIRADRFSRLSPFRERLLGDDRRSTPRLRSAHHRPARRMAAGVVPDDAHRRDRPGLHRRGRRSARGRGGRSFLRPASGLAAADRASRRLRRHEPERRPDRRSPAAEDLAGC